VVFCLLAAIYIVVEKSGKWLVVNDDFKHATWSVREHGKERLRGRPQGPGES
jgi:hypothetical protein